MKYSEMNREQLTAEKEMLAKQYADYKSQNLKLNMARGKPSIAQEEAALDILDVINSKSDLTTKDGVDILNYGCLEGLLECRELFGEILGVPADKVIVGGNSSLSMMFDFLMQCYAKGAGEGMEPWILQGDCKFLCPAPGYDRHFGIAQYLGLEMITVPMTDNGPDMDVVEELVKDPKVKGMFVVPKYANPTGISVSDECVKRIANMECAAPDFRVVWDNAYCIHDLTDRHDDIISLLDECEKAGNPDRAVMFASTSKVTHPGSGVAVLAANEGNLEWLKKRLTMQTIGSDKVNQLRMVRYFKDAAGVKAHMDKLAEIITPHFDIILNSFEKELKELDIATWTNPNGGYFVSLDVMDGCATKVYNLCKEAGVTLTGVGATFPYKADPKDTNIRIAPTYPSLEELQTATDILVLSIKLAAVCKLLGE